jgi:hypothetical protein
LREVGAVVSLGRIRAVDYSQTRFGVSVCPPCVDPLELVRPHARLLNRGLLPQGGRSPFRVLLRKQRF